MEVSAPMTKPKIIYKTAGRKIGRTGQIVYHMRSFNVITDRLPRLWPWATQRAVVEMRDFSWDRKDGIVLAFTRSRLL